MQADPGAHDREPGDSVVDRERAKGDPVRRGRRPCPSRPPAQEVVPDAVLRHFQGDRPVGGLQLVHDDIPVRGRRMGRQIPRRGDHSLPHAALVQVAGTDIRMIQDGFAIRETVDVIGHDKTSMHSLDMEAESHIIKAESCGSSAVNHLLVIITKPSRIAVRGGFSNAYFCIKSLMTSISFSKRVIAAIQIMVISVIPK